MFFEDTEFEKAAFSSDYNVRISISGLAYCSLKTDISKISFLRHVPNHELEMKIIKREKGTVNKTERGFKLFHGYEISVKSSDAPTLPTSIQAEGETDLKEIISMKKLHGSPVKVKEDFQHDETPTILSLHNCTFYTAALTEEEYQLKDAATNQPAQHYPNKKKYGYAIGGIMTSDMKGKTTIKFAGPLGFEIDLLHTEQDKEFIYDIKFDNHCSNREKCIEIIGNGQDFSFYYDILEESDLEDRKFKLEQVSSVVTPEIAACNVVIIDP